MNGDGTRDRSAFEFIQRDPTSGENADPASLHTYLYADADPVDGSDPTGFDDYGDDLEVGGPDTGNLGIGGPEATVGTIEMTPGDTSAFQTLESQEATWRTRGWDIAADMLYHFLYGQGQDLTSLPNTDIAELANDSHFVDVLINGIQAQYPNAMNGNQINIPTPLKINARFLALDDQLAWAFGSLRASNKNANGACSNRSLPHPRS